MSIPSCTSYFLLSDLDMSEEINVDVTQTSTCARDEEMQLLNITIEEEKSETDSQVFSPTGSTQTPLSLTARTPRKKNLRKELRSLRNANKALQKENTELKRKKCDLSKEEFKEVCYKICPPDLAKFIDAQINQLNRQPQGRRYSNDFKMECLQLYFASPKLYKRKLRVKFILPSPTTLFRYVQQMIVVPGLENETLWNMISEKVQNFPVKDRICSLCFDEMAIKANLFYNGSMDQIVGFADTGNRRHFRPAQSATTIMIRGIFSKWSQPVGFIFNEHSCSSGILRQLIEGTVVKLGTIGIRVDCIICDMGSNNVQLCSLWNITPENPYFELVGRKINFMYDPPHLIKSVRNNLLKYDLMHEEKTVSWQHIVKFFNHDQSYAIRGAPKLTNSHIHPNNFEKMKVKFAS